MSVQGSGTYDYHCITGLTRVRITSEMTMTDCCGVLSSVLWDWTYTDQL